jgi:hypothetical protein
VTLDPLTMPKTVVLNRLVVIEHVEDVYAVFEMVDEWVVVLLEVATLETAEECVALPLEVLKRTTVSPRTPTTIMVISAFLGFMALSTSGLTFAGALLTAGVEARWLDKQVAV